MPTELAPKYFKLTSAQAADELRKAYVTVTGKKPTQGVMNLMLAQTALETGKWSLPNYNWGGVKATLSDEFYQFLPCSEIIDGRELKFTAAQKSPYCKFAAYKSPSEGALRYVKTLKRNPIWWQGLQSGNPETFARKLVSGDRKYYTASPSIYLTALQGHYKELKPIAALYGTPPSILDLFLRILGLR